MIRKTGTNKYLVVLIVLSLVLAATTFSMAGELYNNRLVEVNDLQSKLISLQSSVKQSGVLQREIKDTKDDRDQLSFYFITKDTTQDFIGELESMSTASGVLLKLNSLTVKKDSKTSPAAYLRFNIRVDGSFRDVYHFLTALESLPYKVRISTVKVAKLDQQEVIVKKAIPWYGDITFDLVSYIDK
ncbi:MAG: type 4a pilus biogenesis protein PilO [bacterium]|nr:type 4a pilus biogenesis protein PilO [bacterium]